MPRPATTIIPTGWEAHHKRTVAGQFTAACTITQPSTAAGTFNATTGLTERPPGTLLYTGPCRAQHLPQRREGVEFAGEQVAVSIYQLSIPLTDPETVIRPDAIALVTGTLDDTLPGLRLRVTEVTRGTLLWQRDLLCVVDEVL